MAQERYLVATNIEDDFDIVWFHTQSECERYIKTQLLKPDNKDIDYQIYDRVEGEKINYKL